MVSQIWELVNAEQKYARKEIHEKISQGKFQLGNCPFRKLDLGKWLGTM